MSTESKALPKAPAFILLQALKASANPAEFFRKCQENQGDPFCVQLPGAGDIYLTGSAEGAEEIFKASPSIFEPVLPNPVEPLLGPGSLILLGGPRHKKERKLLTPPFQGERMRAYGDIIQAVVLDEWGTFQNDTKINVQNTTQSMTLKVIIRAIFGIESPERIELFQHAIENTTKRYSPALSLSPALRKDFAGLGPWKRFRTAYDQFDDLLKEEIEQRRSGEYENRSDILSLLLALRYDDGTAIPDDELRDQLRTMLVAGHETAATGLAWALFYIHHNPELLSSLQAELREAGEQPTPEQLVKLPLLGGACSEALRIHPVVPIVLRRLKENMTLRGCEIPQGASVGVALTQLHHDPKVWIDPAEFKPDRFVGQRYTPFQYAPFGGGARRCLGAAFATYEMKIILGTILSRWVCEPLTKKVPPAVLQSITMAPTKKIQLLLKGSVSS